MSSLLAGHVRSHVFCVIIGTGFDQAFLIASDSDREYYFLLIIIRDHILGPTILLSSYFN